MSSITSSLVQKKVMEVLEADSTLSAYVKNFEVGKSKSSRKIFPYVSVVSVTEEVHHLCIGRGAPDMHVFSIVVQGGCSNLLPVVAREGKGVEKRGVIRLMDDIVVALYPGNLGGLFNYPLSLESASQKVSPQSFGRTRITTVILSGKSKF